MTKVQRRKVKWQNRYSVDVLPLSLIEDEMAERTCPEYRDLSLVTISALTETGQAESSIQVPNQRAFTGRVPVISSSLADIPCADLGIEGLLEMLNTTLGTSYTLDRPSICSRLLGKLCFTLRIPHALSLRSVLKSCIAKNYDLGTAYAHLRPTLTAAQEMLLHSREERDREMRRTVLVKKSIICRSVPPRRLWDLYSNRVVPEWVVPNWGKLWAISHAWVDEHDRGGVWTPINGYEWPVPIPKDADLNHIQIEMLNLGAEYVRLDVLCLRQSEEGGPNEDLRRDEWKLDIPTIGYVYRMAERVPCYFNGLGRPLSVSARNMDGDRSWFRRAWTLQEVSNHPIISGKTGDKGDMDEDVKERFHKELAALKRVRRHALDSSIQVFDLLRHMQNRVSTNPVDKVAGLAYTLPSGSIPAYSEMQSVEEAWTALINVMYDGYRGDIFFLYPEPGGGNSKWRPTWQQVMTDKLPLTDGLRLWEEVHLDTIRDADWYVGLCIDRCYVRGLAMEDLGGEIRLAELSVEDCTGTRHTFKIVATYQYAIPEDWYTVIGSQDAEECGMYWAVGRRRHRKFEKVSVFRMTDSRERERLKNLEFAKKLVKNYLV
ncbi:uncharacterized protein EV420DRAFT_1649229 [Desarmillaria tabescens]|uniref:Heterokaryon incompatibility domain-containing protein n=1 Tax=Armillaria tabescens TaxID=1929756 RepID=A0AA39JIK2_ARMTA|nr:uncharacterized protein EV420DRAFT_1649229 [Desarmillaria tabescens]KAK0443436.1 hypothetical protein EV420DRAFT_1649229 [Desarmillaria tabescens]